jgi:hypothetical protein
MKSIPYFTLFLATGLLGFVLSFPALGHNIFLCRSFLPVAPREILGCLRAFGCVGAVRSADGAQKVPYVGTESEARLPILVWDQHHVSDQLLIAQLRITVHLWGSLLPKMREFRSWDIVIIGIEPADVTNFLPTVGVNRINALTVRALHDGYGGSDLQLVLRFEHATTVVAN